MSKQCAHCGEEITTDEWYPVATERDDDGEIEIYDFCCESCRAAWREAGDD